MAQRKTKTGLADDGITIDPEFRDLLRGLTTEEETRLRAALAEDGCREPLDVWATGDKDILLDGHNRRRICLEADIKYAVKRLRFGSRAEALDWVLRKQLGKRNLRADEYAVLRGKQYNLEKQSHGTNRHTAKSKRAQNGPSRKTAETLGKQHGVSKNTIKRDAKFAEAIDTIAAVSPKARDAMLAGEINYTRAAVAELAELERPLLKEAAKLIAAGEVNSVKEAVGSVTHDEPASEPAEPTDEVGDVLPPKVRPAFALREKFREAIALQRRFQRLLDELRDSPAGDWLPHQSITASSRNAMRELKQAAPYAICPACLGKGCEASCRKTGWVIKVVYDQPR